MDLAKLAGVLEDHWFDAGTVVFQAGGKGDALFIMREGTAERRVAHSRIGLILPPEVFGELALLTDQPRSSSVVAVTPIRVWVLPQHRVHSLLRAEPELMFELSRAIGLELANARQALGELQRELEQWVVGRLAALTPQRRAVVEAAALFDASPPRVLERLADAPAPRVAAIGARAARAVVAGARGRLRDARGRPRRAGAPDRCGRTRRGAAARVLDVARDLERDGDNDDALAGYRRGCHRLKRLIADTPRCAVDAGARELSARPRGDHGQATAQAQVRRVKLKGMALALVPLLFLARRRPQACRRPVFARFSPSSRRPSCLPPKRCPRR